MASIFKMEPMTYRVGPTYFNERTRSGSWARTFDARVKKKGYESATPVYGTPYMTKPQRGGKGRMTSDLIGYDAVAITRVEYKQAPAPAQAPATTIPKEEAPKSIGGPGANRVSGRRNRASTMGVASQAFAGNVGSVNTELQNDDEVLPYLKGNM